MPEKEMLNQAASFDWKDYTFWSVAIMFVLGVLAKALVSNEPFCFRRFAGELILAMIGAVLFYSFGLMQGMSVIQMMFFGALSALGGVRLVEWGIKGFVKIKGLD
jgi:hypothetical protein